MTSVYVNGEVVHPGAYSLPEGCTLAYALRQAGGFTEFSHQKAILVDRGHKRLSVDFLKVRKAMKYDLILENGDKIFVARAIAPRAGG